MYEPAGEINEVGGDFYEVFRVEGGWAVVLGDVSGKGAAAAALTAEARHTIRTAGALAGDPVEGLRLLDRNLRGRDDAALCSVAMLVLPDADSPRGARCSSTSPATRTRCCCATGGRCRSANPGPLLGVVDEPVLGAVAIDDRARRPARPLHRRGDRGPRRRTASASAPIACARARRLRVSRSWRSSGSARRSRASASGPARTTPRWSRSAATADDEALGARTRGGVGRRIAGRLARCGPMRASPQRRAGPVRRRRRGGRDRLDPAGGRRRAPYLSFELAEPVARHLRDRAVRGPVRDPVR